MMNKEKKQLDLAAVRERLANTQGKQYWRSLEEAGESEEFREFLGREFPRYASEMRDPASRRTFLKLMGASLALAGLSGCAFALRPPRGKIVPYVRLPEGLLPGRPLYFATSMPFNGYASGLLVESNEGRPTKIEGNPDHPASLGSTNVYEQASILTMYDPDRSQQVLNKGQTADWNAFVQALGPALSAQSGSQGAGLRILTESITSPTLINQIQTLLQAFPQARWDQYSPINRDNVRDGAQQAFGQAVDTIYQFGKAAVVVSLDADFLGAMPGYIRYARDFSDQRRVRSDKKQMNRLYVVESTTSITGTMADHRLPLRPTLIEGFTRALAQGLGVPGVTAPATGPSDAEAKLLKGMISDLQQHKGTSIVITGDHQPPIVHALVHAINAALGNVGQTVIYTDPVEANVANQTNALRTLAGEMDKGQVQLLVMLGGNPVYTAPTDVDFASKLAKVPLSVHLSLFNDETSSVSTWHIPATHYLETWGDVRAFDGTASIIQPLIAPLYNGKSEYQLMAALQGQTDTPNSDELVRQYWQAQGQGAGNFDLFWRKTLDDGFIANTALPPKSVAPQSGFAGQPAATQAPTDLDIVFRADSSAWDGSFANNGWMQELPRAITKLVWDNPALISPATAAKLGLDNGNVVEVTSGGSTLRIPVFMTPGHPDDTLTLTLGYGRTKAGKVGNGVGFNTYTLRTSAAPWFSTGAKLSKTGDQYELVTTQSHFRLDDSDLHLDLNRTNLLRVTTIQEFVENPEVIHEMAEPAKITLFPKYTYDGYAWGMVIDLNTCIGCNACVIACQAENNSPVVGKLQVSKRREMHWIRVDRYYSGGPDNPKSYQQPVPCMQCENAPCEVVCPVGATIHDAEGINNMVYNRCVGTKYCSNNCPYKVRRFNFLEYSDETTPVIQLQRNPNVTVRTRGVMEKCTYCIQRIASARQQAEKDNRTLGDGEVVTACQQACPTQAIVFGDINTQGSQVATLKMEPHNYGMLEEVGTRPRTTYLARFENPNPDIKE